MTLFGSAIIILMITGGGLVLGGIFLLGSGALKLAGDAKAKTNLRIGGLLHVATTVPGLGIFVLGLAFQSVGLYYANQARQDDIKEANQAHQDDIKEADQARQDNIKIKELINSAVQKERNDHTLTLQGMFRTNGVQDVRLSFCLAQTITVAGNNPFDIPIGPYFDVMALHIDADGVLPQIFTIIGGSMKLPSGFQNFSRIAQPIDGIVNIGQMALQQTVDLGGAIRQALPTVPAEVPTFPAGSAYGKGR